MGRSDEGRRPDDQRHPADRSDRLERFSLNVTGRTGTVGALLLSHFLIAGEM
jgi:hypothetical protein